MDRENVLSQTTSSSVGCTSSDLTQSTSTPIESSRDDHDDDDDDDDEAGGNRGENSGELVIICW